jgi:hypothetical protein
MFEVGGSIPRRENSRARGVSVCYYFPVRGWSPDALHSFDSNLLAPRVGNDTTCKSIQHTIEQYDYNQIQCATRTPLFNMRTPLRL